MSDQKPMSDARPPHRDWHGTHHTFAYRAQAFRWIGPELVGINFIPLATDMRAWLMQRGQLPVATLADKDASGGYRNPFTFSGTSLSLLLARVVNAYHDFVTDTSDLEPVEADVERLRIYNEVVLYTARFCESVVKQLLHCTHLPEKRYERKSLGELLESPCPTCRKESGKKPHMVSLVGCLAHPFSLCLEFEHCAMDHMDMVNKLRNSQAAHSGIQTVNPRAADVSRAQCDKDCREVLDGFFHMLSHFEKLEERMLNDLAEKGEQIELLRLNGVPAEEANYELIPGRRFEHPRLPRGRLSWPGTIFLRLQPQGFDPEPELPK